MRDEISAAVLFLVRLIERSENFNSAQLERFKTHLSDLLMQRFENHWFPDKPFKGQGYRCIRVNECSRRDAILERAAVACGLKYEDLKLPVELTIWVDPKEVCCRFGEHKGSYCTLASFPGQETEVKVVVENCPPEVKLDTPAAVTVSVKSPASTKVSPHVSSQSNSPLLSSSQTSSNPTAQSAAKDTKTKVTSPSSSTATVGSGPNHRPTGTSSSNSSVNTSSATTNNNHHNSNNHNNNRRAQNSPKQGSKAGGRKIWPGLSYPHPLQPWYMIPPWMAASPPPNMMRSPPRSRYHWAPHKPTLKV
ncbi:protein BTG4-like [Thrips palmi]|uniref:Protein BTG4-like n=1 Tax=Thrips palmi TaxID=161013 RepID=A0A6P8YMP6_THRPL|nr:protein BTG4-like [Thrips palmi]XP_034235292.1 protein BTG4-like [Thrips palmi]